MISESVSYIMDCTYHVLQRDIPPVQVWWKLVQEGCALLGRRKECGRVVEIIRAVRQSLLDRSSAQGGYVKD